MKNVQAVALVVIGFASGSLSAGSYLHAHADRSVTDIPTRSVQLDAMADEVALDETQRKRAHEISDRTHDGLRKLRASVNPEIAALRSTVRSELRAIMDGAQQQRFDLYCARRDAQRSHADD